MTTVHKINHYVPINTLYSQWTTRRARHTYSGCLARLPFNSTSSVNTTRGENIIAKISQLFLLLGTVHSQWLPLPSGSLFDSLPGSLWPIRVQHPGCSLLSLGKQWQFVLDTQRLQWAPSTVTLCLTNWGQLWQLLAGQWRTCPDNRGSLNW